MTALLLLGATPGFGQVDPVPPSPFPASASAAQPGGASAVEQPADGAPSSVTEQYIDVYTPDVAKGIIIRVGRWIACPDIETQFALDNHMGSHSLLFTFDTYTQTGVMLTFMLNKQWTVQAAIHAGTDMAPWYQGAT